MTRYLLLMVALVSGANCLGAWMFGELFDAGILGAISAAAVLASEGIAYGQRNRMRDGRERVWERRDLGQRQPIVRLWDRDFNEIPFDHDKILFTTPDHERAVWPHEIGGFE